MNSTFGNRPTGNTGSATNGPSAKKEIDLGGRILALRKSHGWTLDGLSESSSVSRSALSKIEKSQVSPTLDVIVKIAAGFGISTVELLGTPSDQTPVGRRSVTRAAEATETENMNYAIQSHASELAQKVMLPFVVRLKTRDIAEFSEWDRHNSDDFVFVLSGTVLFYSEWYEPLELAKGDSVYIDSRMGHAFLSKGQEDAIILWINSG
ncbi:MAG: helix-turn-helix domain-containing protein [Paracoccaceae bacterium]